MLRRAFLASAVALAALPAAAQERARTRRAPDIERILDRGRLVVAVAGFAVPPFVTLGADGALSGHDIALAQGMARALGQPVDFERAASFDDIIDKVASGAVDLGLSRLSATLARATLVRFSRPYLVLRHAL
ncbi:MAG TPA: transporter substrate-binding domain-containing protein, partial [Stellaceae bacterium]|nr:transporter substrate-binding domain-containing protein [Stellaceae bacterium]